MERKNQNLDLNPTYEHTVVSCDFEQNRHNSQMREIVFRIFDQISKG